jgi:hypothetical protein
MTQSRIIRPRFINRPASMIAQSPRSSDIDDIRANANYVMDTFGEGQVFSYSAPGPGADSRMTLDVPDYNYYDTYGIDQEFAIVLPSAPKRDTSDPSRRLLGALIPWRVVPGFGDSWCNKPGIVTWRHLDNGVTVERELYRTHAFWPDNWADVDQFSPLDTNQVISLKDWSTGWHGLFEDTDNRFSMADGFWVSSSGATVTKDTSTYKFGTQSLKVTHSSGTNPYAEGPYLNGELDVVEGRDYTLSLYARGDGTAYPTVRCGGDVVATGTSSTSWQLLNAEFTADGGAIHFVVNTSTPGQAAWFDGITLREKGRFRYQPDASGDFTVGFLKVKRMRIAALSIFHAPDVVLTDDQVIVKENDVSLAKAIRGYTGTGQPSIGDLEYGAGLGGTDYSVDDMERSTRRCLLGIGHPLGLSTREESSYYNIRGGNASYFRIVPRNITGKQSGNVSTIPCLYGECLGASGDPAYVKYTALTSGDTWTYEINSDTPAIWSDSNRLYVDAAGDLVKIEVKAPPDGWIRIRSYYLWEDTYAQ